MSAAKRDILIEAGSTWSDVLTWKTGTVPAPVDLSSYTARLQIRATYDSTTPLASITPTLGGALGTITCALTAAETAALDFSAASDGCVVIVDSAGLPHTHYGKVAVYDLEMVFGTTVTRLTQGLVCLSPEVTR